MTDHADRWDTSRWHSKPWPEGEPMPEDNTPSIAELLAAQSGRKDYERGKAYEVLVPSIFPKSEPVWRMRIFAGWEDRDGGRSPKFVTDREWIEIRLAEQTAEQDARLSEVAGQQHNGAAVAEESEFLTTAQVAKLLGREGDEAAVDRALRRSKMVNSRGRGAKRRWERASVQRWIQDTTERPGTAKDYFNPDY